MKKVQNYFTQKMVYILLLPPRLKYRQAAILGVLLLECAYAILTFPPTVTPKFQSEISDTLDQELPVSARIAIAEYVIDLEVAQTSKQKSLGLMYRDTLAENRGMLFIFERLQPVKFWMKNVRVPLDIIFLRNGQVQAIAAAVPPCNTESCPTYGAGTEVNQVIELRGGRAAELGLKVGDRLPVQFFANVVH